MRSLRRSALRLAGLLLLGSFVITQSACGVREAALFTGFSRPAVVQPSQVRGVDSLPVGYDDLGTLMVDCSARAMGEQMQQAWLADVDCTTGRLLGALRERAARVGGTVLVGTWCDGTPSSAGLVNGHCEAGVGRPSKVDLAAPPPEEERATMAWRIKVHYRPRKGPRKAVATSAVTELARKPPHHVVLGELQAECDEGCTESAVAEGLLATAARLGAQAVVAVNCVGEASRWHCSGQASGYLVDPREHREAR